MVGRQWITLLGDECWLRPGGRHWCFSVSLKATVQLRITWPLQSWRHWKVCMAAVGSCMVPHWLHGESEEAYRPTGLETSLILCLRMESLKACNNLNQLNQIYSKRKNPIKALHWQLWSISHGTPLNCISAVFIYRYLCWFSYHPVYKEIYTKIPRVPLNACRLSMRNKKQFLFYSSIIT